MKLIIVLLLLAGCTQNNNIDYYLKNTIVQTKDDENCDYLILKIYRNEKDYNYLVKNMCFGTHKIIPHYLIKNIYEKQESD